MGSIAYRKAVIEDCRAIAELKRVVWNTTYRGIYSDEVLANYDVESNERTFRQIVSNPEIEMYVATDDDRIVGFMTCGKPYRRFGQFEQEMGLLYILKEYQRQGIGRRFFDIARKQVKDAGYSEFIVAVNSRNTDAIQFYLSMGGEIIDVGEKQNRILYKL